MQHEVSRRFKAQIPAISHAHTYTYEAQTKAHVLTKRESIPWFVLVHKWAYDHTHAELKKFIGEEA